MKAKHYEKKNKKHQQMRDERSYSMTDVCYSMSASVKECNEPSFMGLTAGGLMKQAIFKDCLLYTSPSPRDATLSRMPSSA